MSNLLFLLFTLCGLLGVCVGQIVQQGQCDPNLPIVDNFDQDAFRGEWLELRRSDGSKPNTDCAVLDITGENGANIFNVQFNGVDNNFAEQSTGTLTATANPGRFILNSPLYDGPINYWVLLADVQSTFALTYSCENLSPSTRSIHLWVLGRHTGVLTELVERFIELSLQQWFSIEISALSTINHSDLACYVLPIIQPGNSITLPGQCDANIQVEPNFNQQAFTGTWHQISSYHTENSAGSCVRAEYSVGDGVINVVNSQVVDRTLQTITGQASVITTDGSAKLNVVLNVGAGENVEQELWILSTNYNGYAVGYSCNNLDNNQKRIYSWILSRQRQLTPEAQAQVDEVIDSVLELNRIYYTQTDHSPDGCFFFPAPNDQSIEFRGQCEVDAPAMPSFNILQYMGRWYTIESYPNAFQDGSCSNAVYEFNDGRVDIVNSQVKDETLETIRGFAVPAGNDGRGALRVTFPIGGTDATSDYYVLDTDYNNYALVYSCSNEGDDNMRVSSWKLSRSKTLTTDANTAINSAMESILILDQLYFVDEDQSVSGCFFVPIPAEDEPVVFPGQCDPNIGMANFDLAQFVGTWHEIQAYPREEATGQCINHEYTSNSITELNLISSSIADQFRSQRQGRLVAADSTGRLTKSYTTDDGTINTDYWIVATDYENYALAYACVPITADLRKVYSWKLSRTRELSQNSQTAIDTAMQNIDVLQNQYFHPIDQSDRACFFLPDLDPGEPIILPGTCDTSLIGIPNFNLLNFAGSWKVIQSYPTDSQTGSCYEAKYDYVNALTLGVKHEQVVNQLLLSQSGTATMSAEGFGSLQISFPSSTPSELVILATDYNSYALGYSCQNLDMNQRRVWSWKLSRSNTLTDDATAAINQKINEIEVLNNRYYYTVDQSEAACFYFPEVDSTTAVEFRGRCDDNIPVEPNFRLDEYMDLWHDIESYPEIFQTGTCNNALYTRNGDAVDVLNTQVVNQQLDIMEGNAVVTTTDGTAKMSVTFNVGGSSVTADYWVLATDYTSFSLVYSCRPVRDNYYQVTTWKLSREKALSNEANQRINAVMANIPVLDDRYYINRDQSAAGCFYFPKPQENKPVIFPGQCDNNIPAIANLDANQFAGSWHEIEKYPYAQNDRCIDHRFEQGSPYLFTHESFTVRDQRLLSVSSSNMNSDDGTGRLTINIVVNGAVQSVPFWILDTDYDNYALAYGCRNMGDDYRQIFSWKLSRTRELSPASVNAIDTAMQNIDVLDNQYFDGIDQSDEACFFLPELAPGVPIILPGTCDTSLRGLPNFNLLNFAKSWKVIQSYPTDSQTGTCYEADYNYVNAQTLDVTHEQVVNQVLRRQSGTATMSPDGFGSLQFSFPSSTDPSELIILATDYNSYALGYSCQNLPDTNERRVWSWKLSSTNILTDEANAAINQVINEIEVLHAPYYYTVPHSEQACFYFPELGDSITAVEFRGRCDDNIPVEPNFRLDEYMDLWHDIESYPEIFQTGTCNNALYTRNGDAVDVLNTQVVNQQLDIMEGNAIVTTTDGTAKMSVTFNVGGSSVTADYWVLATDYTSFSLVYSCRPVRDNYYQVTTWKLSREKALSNEANQRINAVMANIPVLDDRYYINRDQSAAGCFYFPKPQENKPVIFPGQCDNNIPAIANLDANQFAGSWHEIEKYPYAQNDRCIDHRFEQGSPYLFTHESFTVRDQRLLSVSSSNMNSDDGTGRLTINIVVNGAVQSVPFWILDTDYDNYALAYGCRNMGDDYRQIFSWKLSRTRELSPASVNAIDTAMQNIDVLDNQYFDGIDQSDEACFFLPELAPGVPIILPGTCDTSLRGLPNFNLLNFAKSWKVIQSYPTDSQTGTCYEADYNYVNAQTLDVTHEQVVNQVLRRQSGTATMSPDGFGSLQFSFPSSTDPSELIILATDYNSYALGYSCQNLPDTNERRVWSWKLSSTNILTDEANAAINQVINEIEVLHAPYYYTVPHSEQACFYFPELGDSITAVEFRGRCDDNIPVEPNFRLDEYMDLWHDIESYPEIFQTGTCNNALYTRNGDAVDVLNTQVVNQQLDIMEGNAIVTTTDGTAKMSVTFNVGGSSVTADYWVLATDYTSFSLVYSCRPVRDNYYQVTTWKLSREKALSNEANQRINAVMANIPVLDDRYYINRDQSAAGCFYFPEPKQNEPVIFPGQCDNSYAPLPNFNTDEFMGTWHEIEKYPYGPHDVCIDHRFSRDPNTVTHESFHVRDQTLLSISSNNMDSIETGSFTINIIVDGQVQAVPFWILATDYNDYALAYGCRNINSDYRQIYSWKLSRTRQQTDVGASAINEAMSNIDVLDNRYFEPIQQTDEVCFYLPDIGLNEPVTFIGQCDPNIRVVENFDITQYLGNWRLIETYHTDSQTGSCNAADYSTEDNSILVDNSQVIDQSLNTISGTAIASPDGTGKLVINFPTSTTTPSEHWILATDYDTYALVYSCENIDRDRRRVWSWKMSRTNTLTNEANAQIDSIVNSVDVLHPRFYRSVDRSSAGCFYFPTPNPSIPVIFPGQCDMTIPAQPNFEPASYLGEWYDVESYPAPFQTGTCSRAEYIENTDDTIKVVNTQVKNQLLETWIGSAAVVSDDNTGKLEVTFSVNGEDVTSKYWVLATDYNNYALVYSCENVTPETRSVFSWKLSRTPSLINEANIAINNVINSVQVLEQQYYIPRGHTQDDCFYYPDNNGGDVILPGQCLEDSAVPAVTDFRADLFAGRWHEVSRFPSDLQEGECYSTDYSTSGSNTLTASRSFVYNEGQFNSTVVVTVPTNGRGVISATIDGVPFDDVYILGIDYNDYALAYSCRNLEGNQKQIYSWKLSRSRSGLSDAANSAINELVSSNIDLWEGYYRPTAQDNNACFYYPVFEELPDTIDLPGPCPNDIRGVPNFNTDAYLGRWYEIGRYPARDQIGQCNRAEYSLNTVDGVQRVVVYNNEVTEETLLTQYGYADVASADGSGHLSVTFDVDGETRTANYYVLATDYTTYSLVYSCADLQSGWRRVSSWKLSRTKTLTTTAMDAVIAATQGLSQNYYQSTSQSDEHCFYIPFFNINTAPRFRGQCEDIVGVPDFEVQRYLGWWHEIERYTVDGTDSGECRSSEYIQEGNTYRVVDTWVQDNEGFTLSGTVTASSNGRLTRTMPDNQVQDIWVLGTDYETYALLYYCVQEDEEYRRVWSAKHSKSRALTPEAQSAMAPIIANNQVLHSPFYRNVLQSDAMCFHYPPVTGAQVIIPGQCNTNIPVVQNLNIEAFEGTWYQTERYDPLNGGSCVGSRFAVNDEGFTVFNVEVRNEEDIDTEGVATVDASGLIELTLPNIGSEGNTTTSLYILATDYTNYAVAYNCINVGPYQRQVRAWKLSRERQMSIESGVAVDALIQRQEELHQPYFNQIPHNEDCPEPSTAFLVKSSIILLLVCAILQWLL